MSLGGLHPETVSHPPGEVARVVLVQYLTNAFVQEIVVVAGDDALATITSANRRKRRAAAMSPQDRE